MPHVNVCIGTRRIVITITTDDGTFVVSIPKLS
jgi:predicted RNase H-like HicB family nuclease